jgi:glycerol-3-phosphate acyltransferase PlsY
MTFLSPFCWVLSYLSGSLPFGLWIPRWIKGVDVREGGSGHLTTTNAIRQAGWAPGVLVFLLDTLKGFLPVFLAIHLGLPDGSIALTAALAVIGHCWPILAQFRGGMGLAVTGGILLAASPLGFGIGVVVLVFFLLIIRHAARAGLLTGLVFPVVFWLVGLRGMITWISIPVGLVIAARYSMDWKRTYRELWLDREKHA